MDGNKLSLARARARVFASTVSRPLEQFVWAKWPCSDKPGQWDDDNARFGRNLVPRHLRVARVHVRSRQTYGRNANDPNRTERKMTRER